MIAMLTPRVRFALPVLCSCSMALIFSALSPSQDKGDAPKGKAQAKGNNLIRPLADLEKDLKGKLERIKVHGKSLEGNLEGDSADRDVFVYLPPSYQREPNRRYPVVYTLHGYGLHAEQWVGFTNFASLEKDVAAGTAKEMILVSPDAYSLQNGSFYSNSAATGDWETFLAVELVGYIDSHYRTLANRASRGLMGHSMGGYGTFRLGMKHPEVFSSLFSMSACCVLDTGEVTPAMVQLEAVKTKEDAAKVPFAQKSPLARAAAWSANPDNPPLFFDLPVKDGKPQPVIAAKWMANSLMVKLEPYALNLKMMKAIRMNVGLQDALLQTNRDMDRALTSAGITHTFETFEGDHNGQVGMNFETKVLPFFSNQLSFTQAAAGVKTQGTYARIKVHGKSLEGNLSGEPADRDVSVYLPPGYQTQGTRRYPVLYLLHGYTNSDVGWFGPESRGSFAGGNTMTAAADRAFTSGAKELAGREFILVMPNAYTIYQGSMFSNSVTTGDWESFIAKDLVAYMDSHYRTIPERASRGLAGHSMGGYGTVRIAAKYPQVFSSIYILSACCLTASLNPNPQSSAKAEALKGPEDARGAERGLATLLAEAAAWSPNPQNPPFYFDLPAKDGKIQPAIVAKWAANAPLAMIDQYAASLKTLRIGIDVGDKDTLAASNRELNRVLKGYGIQTSFEVYDGDHTNHIVDRMERVVLPFFAKTLAFPAAR
jgi:S-formylglutathione hydrolase